MQAIVSGETPFKCLKDTFAVGPVSGTGYTLNYAVSKFGPWSAYPESTGPNDTLVVNNVTPFMWFKLDGNTDTNVEIIL